MIHTKGNGGRLCRDWLPHHVRDNAFGWRGIAAVSFRFRVQDTELASKLPILGVFHLFGLHQGPRLYLPRCHLPLAQAWGRILEWMSL